MQNKYIIIFSSIRSTANKGEMTMKFIKRIMVMIVSTAVMTTLASCGAKPTELSFTAPTVESQELGFTVGDKLSKAYKGMEENNPVSSDIFFADPTAVEYEGRLYIYGTNDSQEFQTKGGFGSNGYGSIGTLVCYSTEDMSNFRYEGTIPVTEIATWAGCSWAPSIVSREESDGKTHFYLYFANSGANVGVLTSTSPTGPWKDPIGKPLVDNGMKQLKDDPVSWCFDPGVCIDDNGVGWIAIGGGEPAHPDESGMRTGNCRLAKLGKDMTSIDGDFCKVPTYFHFEANELNYIGGKYVLTYCSNYADRSMFPIQLGQAPQTCSMCYMTSDDPLNPDSWQWGGEYLTNPNQHGYPFSNNHSHLQKFGDKYYLLYQNVSLLENMNKMNVADGFRSIGIDYCEVDEKNAVLGVSKMSDEGVKQIAKPSALALQEAETAHVAAGLTYFYNEDIGSVIVTGIENGDWLGLTQVDFGSGANTFAAQIRGKGIIEVGLDSVDGEAVGSVQFDTGSDFAVVSGKLGKNISGVHDLYFVFGGSFVFDKWQFAYSE